MIMISIIVLSEAKQNSIMRTNKLFILQLKVYSNKIYVYIYNKSDNYLIL